MLAAKDSSVFSQRIAIFLNSFIRQKKFSIRCRHLYFPRSYRLSVLRPLRGGMTGSISFCVNSLISQSASKALSASSAPKLLSLISDRTPQMSLRCPGSSMKSHKLPKASVRARIFVVIPPLERPIACLKVPLLRPARGGGF